MSNEVCTPHRDRLQEVSDAFDEWRRSRPKRGPIPEELWEAAAALSPTYPVFHISRTLRLDYTKLKRRINETAPTPSGFIKAQALFAPAHCLIQLKSPEGFCMEIRAEGVSCSGLVPLIAAFLGKNQ